MLRNKNITGIFRGLLGLVLLVISFSCALNRHDEQKLPNLIQTAGEQKDLGTFVEITQISGLDDELSGTNSYTLFIPSNQAFSEFSSEELKALLQPENKEKLKKLVEFHIVEGLMETNDLVNEETLDTLNGEPLTVLIDNGHVYINGAFIEQTDIKASNGIIHVIDKVLVPQKP